MFASNVIISEETRKKNQLNKRQQGKLRYKRLQEMEQSGELSNASTRNELAQLLGYPKGDKAGISWVNNMVNRGYIKEYIAGAEKGKVMKEFHLTSKIPDYDFSQVKAKNKAVRENKVVQENKVEEINRVEPEQKPNKPTRVVVEYCGMTITIDNAGAEYVSEIIKTIK